ncbi:P-loop NTPase [Paenarthrobacter sp. PH39-S1]|uniref:AAA family ATPase n=1 Tax=Paenarthrobacter sp. PH39-S1 TaxID=3046204 RepID=UPI0024B9AD05|nr:P-loop NTPase [Paenarthrobacter sp. PH39-S1]MDJ0356440.1 P-loop NTPase [Paenarthrobacter sp. PH39-S1]
MQIPVVTVGQTTQDLIGGLEKLHGQVTVVRRCGELTELLAACQSGLARAAVVLAGSEELTATLVDRLAAVGVAVVVLADDGGEVSRLRGIGALVAASTTDPATLAGQIREAVATSAGTPGRGTSGAQAHPATATSRLDPAAGRGEPPPGHDTGEAAPPDPTGNGGTEAISAARILAVWGPTGAPGRTMVAVNIAAELAASGLSVLLVDADSYGPTVSASLGLLDESAGLAQACRLADQGLLTADGLRTVATPVVFRGGHIRVLTGLTRADRWPELRAAALEGVLAVCRELAEVTVIDCGFCLESDEELSYDTLAPRRNAATLASLAAADSIYAVGAADAVGLPRLVRGLAELAGLTFAADISVVLNKVRRSAAGRGPERALQLAWDRFGPPLGIGHFLPWDPAATDKTLSAGQLLLEAAPDSALRTAVSRIVCAPVQRRRRSAVGRATARLGISR